MRYLIIVILFGMFSIPSIAQEGIEDVLTSDDGRFYVYWGWNRGWFTDSDIHFTGEEYDFELDNVIAKDRQTPFSLDQYFSPVNFTIPQYNFRFGYYFNDTWDVSIGFDHMKYVVQNSQTVKISGHINSANHLYNGDYNNDDIVVSKDFLKFEHTDGLNYINFEVRRTDNIFQNRKFVLSINEGIGVGVMLPKTNTTLLNKDRYDEVHLAGYGLSLVVGARATFYNSFFIQSELKGGFIDMPNIRTTNNISDRASQHFFFSQVNILFGAKMNFNKK